MEVIIRPGNWDILVYTGQIESKLPDPYKFSVVKLLRHGVSTTVGCSSSQVKR